MPISPTGSTKSSFRGPLELDYGRSPDRSAHRGGTSLSVIDDEQSQAAKQSPVIPDDHPMPWEFYENEGVSPPPLPSPTKTVFTFTTAAPSDQNLMARTRSASGRQMDQSAVQDSLHLTTIEHVSAAAPTSPHSAGSSGGASILPGTTSTSDTVTTPPSALRSPGATSTTSGFFASLRPASPRITTTSNNDGGLRRDKERTASSTSTAAYMNNGEGSSSGQQQQRIARDPKTLDARSRRPSSVFEHVGNVFERWGKRVHQRTESKEGRSATPITIAASAALATGSALAVAPEEPIGAIGSNQSQVEYLESPSRPVPPPLLRNWSGSSAISMYDDFEVVSRRNALLGRTLIQVTEDNERFAVVDVSGLGTAAGIKERMLSKLHRFDDDPSAFSIYRTEIGASEPEGPPLPDDGLFALCLQSGDDKGNLKFLVSQLGPPSEPNHDAVPPPLTSPRSRRAAIDLPLRASGPDSSSGSPRSPVMGLGTSTSNTQLHGKSNSISSVSSASEAQHPPAGYDSGSEASKQRGVGSGTLARSRMIRRGGGAASGDESQYHHRGSTAGSPRLARPSAAPVQHREHRSGSLGDRGTMPSPHALMDPQARSRQTSDSTAAAHVHHDIAEEVEELRPSLEGGRSGGGSSRGRPSPSPSPLHSIDRRPSPSSVRRPATSQGALGSETPTSGPPAAALPPTIGAATGVSGQSRQPSDLEPPKIDLRAAKPRSLQAGGGSSGSNAAHRPADHDINDAARMYAQYDATSPSTPSGERNAHQLWAPGAVGGVEEQLQRVRRGSDVGPQTQAQQQQNRNHAAAGGMLPDELFRGGADERYPSLTVARASVSSSSADSGNSSTSSHQQQQHLHGSGSGQGPSRQPIDFDSLNARHGLRPGLSAPMVSSTHLYGSSAPSTAAAHAVVPPASTGGVVSSPWGSAGVDTRSPPFAAVQRPPPMRPAMSSDGYGHGYPMGGPPNANGPYSVAFTRSPASYATSEFGMRTTIGSPPLHNSNAAGPSAPYPFPQRPHTFHDAGYYHPQHPQQHPALGPRPSPRPTHPPLNRGMAPPENPYTQALFPHSSSRQVSEFQRSGQSAATSLSPGMTVQESMRHAQQHTGSHHHHGFGPREPRVAGYQVHGQARHQQPQQPHHQGWEHGYQHHAQHHQQFRPPPSDPRYAHVPQSRLPVSPRPPAAAIAPPLPASIPLGIQSQPQPQPQPPQQAQQYQQTQPRTSIPSSDRSSTSSYVSSSTGGSSNFHQQQQQQHAQQQHQRNTSTEGAGGGQSAAKSGGSQYYYNTSNDDAHTAPTSARSSRSGPPLSPDGDGNTQRRDRAGSGSGSAMGVKLPAPTAMSRTCSDGSAGRGGNDEAEEELDLSKIRPLPQPPTSAGSTGTSGPFSPTQQQREREDEGTLKAAQWAAMMSRKGTDGDSGGDTLRQGKLVANAGDLRSPSSASSSAAAPTESSGAGSTSTIHPTTTGDDLEPEPGTGTFASFASFADDDDDTEGGTWAKPLDAMPSPSPVAAPSPSLAAPISSQDMAPSVTLRPPQPSVIGRATPTSPDGQPARTNSPRRPELRLTIDSPRSTSPLVGAAPSPRGPRASPGTMASAGVVSPRLGGESTLRPSSKGEGGSATLTPSGIQRSSSFARRGDNEWALRPPPEQLYENLDDFFPRHDLDKPVLDLASGAPGPASAGGAAASPTVGMANATSNIQRAASPSHASSPTSANALARHKKSIRRVAQDRVRGAGLGGLAMTSAVGPAASSSSAAQAPTRASSDLARRPSTKLWGTKLLEVTPGHEQSASGSSSASSSSSSSASSSNRPVFKWVKGDLIGKGTYGRVYIALNATTGEMIAVKQVELPTTEHDRCDARQRDVVAALKSEISTLKDLDHPHIVSYLGFEETPEFLHLFLEYVPGGSIASVLRKYGKLEEGIIKYFVHQVLSGLSYLHERGVLHRDLKGDNLLVNLDGTVKISDFGTMRKSDDIYADVAGMSLQGSVFWMAPEVVLLTKKGYSAKVDIWSLGCVTLEMFAGRRPWSDDEAVQAMFKIGKEGRAPPVPPDVRLSREAAHFLRNCFFIDPNDRPTAARLLDHVFPDVPGGWSFEETRLWRMMQRSLQNRAAGAR